MALALALFSGCSDKDPKVSSLDKNSQVGSKETQANGSKSEIIPSNAETISSNQTANSKTNSGESLTPSTTDTSKNGSNGSNSANSLSKDTQMQSLEKELLTIYFDFDKFNINADNQAKIGTDSLILKEKAGKFSFKLEGNCDEWGSDEYNIALGLKRANEVKKALIAEGVDANKVTMVSFGENNPACKEKTQDCWSKNRRVDFKLLP